MVRLGPSTWQGLAEIQFLCKTILCLELFHGVQVLAVECLELCLLSLSNDLTGPAVGVRGEMNSSVENNLHIVPCPAISSVREPRVAHGSEGSH